jgi:ABC-type transport system involved in multi-copper enzyme maturation permease subunit
MFANLWAVEHYKTFKRKVFWITLAGTVGLLVVLVLGLYFAAQIAVQQGAEVGDLPTLLWPNGLVVVLNDFLSPGFIGGIVAVILGTALWAEEYRWGMLHLWLSRGVPRATLLSAKAAALVLPLFLSLTAGLLVAGGVTGALTALSAGAAPAGQVDFGQLALSLLRSTAAVLPIAALTLFLGVLTRSTAGALGAGMGYLLLGEQILGGLLGVIGLSSIGMYLPITLGKLLTMHNNALLRGFQGVQTLPVGGGVACAGVLLWTAVFLGLAVWVFGRQDLSV